MKYENAEEDSDSDNEEQFDQSDEEEEKHYVRWKAGKAVGKSIPEGSGAGAKGRESGVGSSPKFRKDIWCNRCRNAGHLAEECGLNERWCAICRTTTHTTEICHYNARIAPMPVVAAVASVVALALAAPVVMLAPARRPWQPRTAGTGANEPARERKFLCYYCNQPGHWKVDCDLFKCHKAEKEATRGSEEDMSAPAVNAILIIKCDDAGRP